MDVHANEWAKARKGYVKARRCVTLSSLEARTAKVSQTAPGHFVHEVPIQAPGPANAGDVANTGFIVGNKAVAVIDAGSSRKVAEALYLAVRSRTELPIRHLILTHMHPDHSLGAEVFREAGAEIIGAANLGRALSARREAYMTNFGRILGDAAFHGTRVALPDREIEERESIDLGGRILELRAHATAHTDNDLTALDRQSATIWMGDLVFLRHTPVLDGSIRGWLKLLKNLRESGAKRMVPGHGPAVAPYPDGAKPTLNYLTELARQTRRAVERGESIDAAIEHLGRDLRGEWRRFDEFNPRNATSAYVELEWE